MSGFGGTCYRLSCLKSDEIDSLKQQLHDEKVANANVCKLLAAKTDYIREVEGKLAQAQADCAARAEALEEMAKPPYKDSDLASLMAWVNARATKALSTTAGSEILEELELLRKVASAARIASMVWHQKAMDEDTRRLTTDVTEALDAIGDAWRKRGGG